MRLRTNIFNKIGRSHMYWGRKPLEGLQDAFRDVNEKDIILDPFCGGGNAVIAALRQKARVIASDLNPMALFLTKVLIRPINIPILEKAFREIEIKVANKILKNYTLTCPKCHKKAYIDFIFWRGIGKSSKPEQAKLLCPHCSFRGLATLSLSQIKYQIRQSRIKAQHWFPKTQIQVSRATRAHYHYQLFTGRNLSALSELFYFINKVQNENCRDALKYVFTAMLYNCSEMQMFSEFEPSSSRGWTACRYYIPPKRKEKNVWHAFQNRFKNFLSCKKTLNDILPYIRITDSPKIFFSKKYEVLLYKANAFYLKNSLTYHATKVFLDPPYNEDIEYFAFSEFWGTWLKMSFDFPSEWNPKLLKAEGLRKLLKSVRKKTKESCKVILAFGAKNTENWNLNECISESGYLLRKTGTFFYDNSNKRGGMDRRNDQFFILEKKKSYTKKQTTKNQYVEMNLLAASCGVSNFNKEYACSSPCGKPQGIMNLKEKKSQAMNYLRASDFFFPDISNEALRERAAHYLAPSILVDSLSGLNEEDIQKIRGKENKIAKTQNKKTYYTLCFVLIKKILDKDKWKVSFINDSLLINTAFENILIRKNSTKQDTSISGAVAFEAQKNNKRIHFCFYDEKKILLKETASNIYHSDGENCNVICVMIVKSKKKMNELRKVEQANNWRRVFFVCFDDIREKYEKIDSEKSLKICAKFKPIETMEQKPTIQAFDAIVVENKPVGGVNSKHYKLRFKAPELRNIVPGQFVMIDTTTKRYKKNGEPVNIECKNYGNFDLKPKSFLKRPFGIHRAFYKNFGHTYLKNLILPNNLATILHTVHPNQFDISYKVITIGLGTNELTKLKKKDKIQMLGPLGKKFDLRDLRTHGYEEIHVIGGGVGMAPLIFMVQALRFYAFRVKTFVGIESLDSLEHKDILAKGYAEDWRYVKLYIDDLVAAGVTREDIYISCDREPNKSIPYENIHVGVVSEQYEEYLRQTQSRRKNVISFTCGPQAMMKAIKNITGKHNIPLKVLMEKRMACGIGVCFSCVCKTEKNGKNQYSRACIDGPIFDSKEIKEW